MKPETCITIESPGIFVKFGEIIAIIRGGFDINTDDYLITAAKDARVYQRVNKNGQLTAKVIKGRLVLESKPNLWSPLEVQEGERVTTFEPWVRPWKEEMSQAEQESIQVQKLTPPIAKDNNVVDDLMRRQ